MDYFNVKEKLLDATTQNQIIGVIDDLTNESTNNLHKLIILEQILKHIQSIKQEHIELYNLYKSLCIQRTIETVKLKSKIKIVHPELKELSTKDACSVYINEMRTKRVNCSKFIKLLNFGQLYVDAKIKDKDFSKDSTEETLDVSPNTRSNNSKQISREKHIDKLFIDYLHHTNKDALLEKLHELIDGKKGKLVATLIIALEKSSFIGGYENRSTLYNTMRNEFGDIGTNSGLNDFITNDYKIPEMEINKYIDILKGI